MEMRKLTPEEIDDAPSWAISYAAFTKDGTTYVTYHERHFGYTLPLPKREEFDISGYKPEEFELFIVDCSGDVTLWLEGRQLKDITRPDSIALARHFKLTPEELK